ncbi:hypothetical protein EC951288_0293B, partial [Escherichia coli 95.1288]
RNMPSFG